MTTLLLALAAAVGASARYVIDVVVTRRTAGCFPYATLGVNVAGSLILGVLTGLSLHHHLPAAQSAVLGTGFCGAFTTFSTFSFETVRLIEVGRPRAAAGNAVLGTTVGLLAAAAGLGLAVL